MPCGMVKLSEPLEVRRFILELFEREISEGDVVNELAVAADTECDVLGHVLRIDSDVLHDPVAGFEQPGLVHTPAVEGPAFRLPHAIDGIAGVGAFAREGFVVPFPDADLNGAGIGGDDVCLVPLLFYPC